MFVIEYYRGGGAKYVIRHFQFPPHNQAAFLVSGLQATFARE